MPHTKLINRDQMSQLCREAGDSKRLRCNKNLHPQLTDPVQRFCNALQPGTYVRPHRHAAMHRWELFVILQGEVGILLFDDSGRLRERTILEATGDNRIIEIPAGQWHSLYALQADSVLFETKPGPYEITTDKDFAEWAPLEGGLRVRRFLQWYEQANVGDLPPALS